jgi:NDP-sugar pyrophosphorylase family protein
MKSKSLLDTAMILAAGFGTRLKPLTENTPKALVEYKGKPMIFHVIKKLESFGIKKIVINTHHLAGKINEYFAANRFDSEIFLVHEEDILGTGGGIKNAEKLLKGAENFLVYNADVSSGINIQEMFGFHLAAGAIATLAVKNRITGRYLLRDSMNNLVGRTENGNDIVYRKSDREYSRIAFCGIYILNEGIFEYLPAGKSIDIIPEFMKLAESKRKIKLFDIGNASWQDLGNQVIET